MASHGDAPSSSRDEDTLALHDEDELEQLRRMIKKTRVGAPVAIRHILFQEGCIITSIVITIMLY